MIRRGLVFFVFLAVSGLPLPEEGSDWKSDDDDGERTVCLRVNKIQSKHKVNTNLPEFLIEILGPAVQKGIKYKILKADEENQSRQGIVPKFNDVSSQWEASNFKSRVDSVQENNWESPHPDWGQGAQVVTVPSVNIPTEGVMKWTKLVGWTSSDWQGANRAHDSTEPFDEVDESSKAGVSTTEDSASTFEQLYAEANTTESLDNKEDGQDSEESQVTENYTSERVQSSTQQDSALFASSGFSTVEPPETPLHNAGLSTDEPPAEPLQSETSQFTLLATGGQTMDVSSSENDATTLHTTSPSPLYYTTKGDSDFEVNNSTGKPLPTLHANTNSNNTTTWPRDVITDENGILIDVLGTDIETSSESPTPQTWSLPPNFGGSSLREIYEVLSTGSHQDYQETDHTTNQSETPSSTVLGLSEVDSNSLSSDKNVSFYSPSGEITWSPTTEDVSTITVNNLQFKSLESELELNDTITEITDVTENTTEVTENITNVTESLDDKIDGELDYNLTEPTTEGYIKLMSDLQETSTTDNPQTTLFLENTQAITSSTELLGSSTYTTHPPAVTTESEMTGPTTERTTQLTFPSTTSHKPLPNWRLLPNEPQPLPEPEISKTTAPPVTADYENFNNFTIVFPTVISRNRQPHFWRHLSNWHYISRPIYFQDMGTP